jgi:uncharacterized membrane protein
MIDHVKGETSIDIQAPVQEVYEYLLDFTRHPEWTANLQRVSKLSEGTIGVGTTFRANEGPPPLPLGSKMKMMFFFVIGLMLGAKPFSEAEITALEPGRCIVWKARLPRRQGDFNRVVWEIVLQANKGGTHLTQRFDYSPQSWTARQMVGRADRIEQACAVSLARLKAVLEQ